MENLVDEIMKLIPDADRGEIFRRLDLLINKYKLPPEEAKRSILNTFRSFQSRNVKISEIKKAGEWVSLRAKVIQLWEPGSDSISQVGLLGDDSGVVKFVAWARSSLPKLEEGKMYEIRNAVVDSFNQRFQINLNRRTKVMPLEEAESAPVQKISDLKDGGKLVTVRGKVIQLWEPGSDSISQVGLLGDDSGVVKFVIWRNSDVAEVSEGKTYTFCNVMTDEFEGRISVKVTKGSRIIPAEEEIPSQFCGALVELREVGIQKICEVCGKICERCDEHGETEEKLIVRGILDDGKDAVEFLMLGRMAEEFCEGITELGKLKRRKIGKYLSIAGRGCGRCILVEGFSEPQVDVDSVLGEVDR